MSEKICTCNPRQGEIKPSEALDIINKEGKIVARYNKDCDVHGFKRME